jgi:hypothetical protein
MADGLQPSGHLDIGLSVTGNTAPLTWDWDWDWVTLGRPLGHPRVTQGSRADHASVEWKKWLCLQQKAEREGGAGRIG